MLYGTVNRTWPQPLNDIISLIKQSHAIVVNSSAVNDDKLEQHIQLSGNGFLQKNGASLGMALYYYCQSLGLKYWITSDAIVIKQWLAKLFFHEIEHWKILDRRTLFQRLQGYFVD